MTTTTVSIDITCPAWCTRTAEEHRDELWNMDGDCCHHSGDVTVTDPVGHERPLEAPSLHPPITLYMSTLASPDGRETESPVVYIEGHEMSVAQALATADAIKGLVQTYRDAGGVA